LWIRAAIIGEVRVNQGPKQILLAFRLDLKALNIFFILFKKILSNLHNVCQRARAHKTMPRMSTASWNY